ncbi:hypothetical protein GCWU000341_00819 [Oribacterium sp. oral taxon 078 str. F0262]|nr:hypothetical protein GCWU000341_00819 [Oribacterium sp. oral taxon 078 str. F0262]
MFRWNPFSPSDRRLADRVGALPIFDSDLTLCLPKSRPSFAPALKDSASPGRHQPISLRETLLFEKWSSTLRVCLMADFCA